MIEVMRIITASCSAVYTGRGNTTLPTRKRVILIKDDGSVLIHNETGTKPLNYMGAKTVLTVKEDGEGKQVLMFDSRRENLTITLHDISSDTTIPLSDDDPGLERDGTESQLQEWLAENMEVFGPDHELIQREHPTLHGPVDLMAKRGDCDYVVIEVKRVATPAAIHQINRYVEAVREEFPDATVEGVLAAIDIRPKAEELALKKSFKCVTIPATWRDPTERLDNRAVEL